MKIVFAVSEAVPFAKTGGLADVAGALPLFLEQAGHEVILVMPGYRCVHETGIPLTRLSDAVSCATIGKNIRTYFIESKKYFDRDGLYQDAKGDHADNAARFAFYCARALELLKKIDFRADIIHIHDWQSALIPVYLKTRYASDPWYKDIRTLLTVHNLGYQGIFPAEKFSELNLPVDLFIGGVFEFYGMVNILKGGIAYADLINTVSPTYSREIQTVELGFGLQETLSKRAGRIFGILNGLDYTLWNPETDRVIAQRYGLETLEKKSENKRDLQRISGLAVRKDVPLFGMVSRLAEQKGIHLILEVFDEIVSEGAQAVILGVGDQKYHTQLRTVANRYKDCFSLNLSFDDDLARKIYAGSDFFLMPSQYEPCGLGQMIGLRYGSLPVVYKTGGLADTVDENNGFVFENYTSASFLEALRRALEAFKDPLCLKKRMSAAMQCRFSWEESSLKYQELYEKARGT